MILNGTGLAAAETASEAQRWFGKKRRTPKPAPDFSQAFALRWNGRTLLWVVPDPPWPNMWRVAFRDGRLSDLANLARAMDAAAIIAERGPPRRNPRCLQWRRPDAGKA
jgi:hypothetical protein